MWALAAASSTTLACSLHRQDLSECWIYVVVDKVIMSFDYDPDDVYRHEVGHCWGWKHE